MLPEIFSEGLLSLHPSPSSSASSISSSSSTPAEGGAEGRADATDLDKLALSVLFYVDLSTGLLLDSEHHRPRLARTVIRTTRLSYAFVQELYGSDVFTSFSDDERRRLSDEGEEEEELLSGGGTWEEVRADLYVMKEMAKKMRAARLEGADGGEPLSPVGEPLISLWMTSNPLTAHDVIQELMLYANHVVAKLQIESALAEFAVLRNQRAPGEGGFPVLAAEKSRAEKLDKFGRDVEAERQRIAKDRAEAAEQ